MTTCESCQYPNNWVDIEHRCCKCGNSTSVSTADLIAELRARGHFALDKDAPEVVALREARKEKADCSESYQVSWHIRRIRDAGMAVCRAAGIIDAPKEESK